MDSARASSLKVKIGLPADTSPYPDGTSTIMVGATHEFGSEDGRIPERSWLRSAMREHRDEHRKLIRALAQSVISGKRDPRQALELLGTQAAADVRAMIVAVVDPPNTAETIRRKGSSNPLVDTGHLRQQVTHRVVEGDS